MRRIENPPNPFHGAYREWLGPAPEARLEVYEEQAASILTRNDSPDIPFRWSVNPYRGCQHACAYCYARRTHEYLDFGAGTDFETRIVAKVNAPELLAAALGRRGWKREFVIFSGVTDPYQPLEAVYRLTQRCLGVCLDFQTPVAVVTKSYLVARDAALLGALHQRAGARVYFSIPFADPEVARRLEPHAPPPARQFEALRRVVAAGVPAAVMIAPVIPGLNDRDIPAVLRQAADAGATSACYAPVRLPGSVADVFLARLKTELPAAAARVEARIRALRDGKLNDPAFGDRMQGAGAYWDGVRRLFESMAVRYGLSCGQPWERELPEGAPAVRQLPLFQPGTTAAPRSGSCTPFGNC